MFKPRLIKIDSDYCYKLGFVNLCRINDNYYIQIYFNSLSHKIYKGYKKPLITNMVLLNILSCLLFIPFLGLRLMMNIFYIIKYYWLESILIVFALMGWVLYLIKNF